MSIKLGHDPSPVRFGSLEARTEGAGETPCHSATVNGISWLRIWRFLPAAVWPRREQQISTQNRKEKKKKIGTITKQICVFRKMIHVSCWDEIYGHLRHLLHQVMNGRHFPISNLQSNKYASNFIILWPLIPSPFWLSGVKRARNRWKFDENSMKIRWKFDENRWKFDGNWLQCRSILSS